MRVFATTARQCYRLPICGDPSIYGRSQGGKALSSRNLLPETELGIGDIVIHPEHGLGRLEGIETVGSGEFPEDFLRLGYAGPTAVLAPMHEIDRISRYGSADAEVSLDRPDGERWHQRRAEIESELAAAAEGLIALAAERGRRAAPVLNPPRRAYERFTSRFPYPETPDQTRAIAAVLSDLRSGRPMDRLICGEVGFGKTEIALRATAAAVMCGKQVAVIAPTTVLARQHFETFGKRFAPFGIEVVQLSRLVSAAEAKAGKQKLQDGTAKIAIGTHALLSRSVRFRDLGLLVIDEEQRFGTGHKQVMRELGHNLHVLTMTATPIPRTLEIALVGIAEISVIATPPARRQPVRTVVQPFDPVSLREALLWENRRGGQSFVVTPRIEEIDGLAHRLAEFVPELDIAIAHAKLPPAELDRIMVEFADGAGDVLLSTSIIESGLDLPAANTMIVFRPDRFGLAQLHQLRGRVGRGRARASCYLLLDPEAPLTRAAEKRLQTLAALERPGAGLEISVRDLDLRGAGDILGPTQAGHVKLIGLDLYQQLLERAIATAQGHTVEEEWRPELRLGVPAIIPADYIPEDELRVRLYRRIADAHTRRALDALEDEIEDRFGPPPEPTRNLLDLAWLRRRARRLGLQRIDAGPEGIAVTFRGDPPVRTVEGWQWREERLVRSQSSSTARERLALVEQAIDEIAG